MDVVTRPPFRVDCLRGGDGIVFCLHGELDLATAPAVEDAVLTADLGGVRRVTVDLRELGFMDCSGVRMLVQLERRSREDGWTFEVCTDDAGHVVRLMRLCRVEELLTLVTVPRGRLAG